MKRVLQKMKKNNHTCIGSVGRSKGLNGEFYLNSFCNPKENIIDYIKDSDNQRNITDLLKLGINLNYPLNTSNYKVVVITGKFLTLSRDEITSNLMKLGYRVSNSVSKKTQFLICGEKPGGKQKKANDLGIKIIYENELIKLLAKAH